jgi:hypothetical protein
MLAVVRDRLSYANVVATLALFVALGGSSYAALSITSKDVKNRSLKGGDLKKDTVTGSEIRESKLGRVPSALNAASADVSKSAGTATTAGSATTAAAADVARDAQNLAGQSAGAFEKSTRTQFGNAAAAPAGVSGESVLLSWPEMGVEVTNASPAASGCGGQAAIAVRNTKSSGPSALVFSEGDAGPVVAPGGKGYDCGAVFAGNDEFRGQVTDSTNKTLFVDCVQAQGQIRCLGTRSEP